MQKGNKQTLLIWGGWWTPWGADTQVQFNDWWSFWWDARFYFDKSTWGTNWGDFWVAAWASIDGYWGELYTQWWRPWKWWDVQAFAGNAIKPDSDGGDLFFGSGSANWVWIGWRVYFQAWWTWVWWTGWDVEFQIWNWDTKWKYLFRTANTSFTWELNVEWLTANQVYTFPDATWTLALTSDIPSLTNYFNKTVDDTDDISVWATNKFNQTHTWDVTGSTTLTVDKTAITWKTAVTAVWTDYVLISDTSDSWNLKKALVSDFWWGGGVTDWDKGDVTVSSSWTVWTIDEPALRKSETSVNNQPLFYTLNKFDTLQTNFYGSGTVALETSLQAEWTGCMKLTLSTWGNCWPRVAFTTPVNFYQKAMTIKCRASAWANITTAEILFGTDSSFSNYYLYQWKGSSNWKLVTPPDNEWIERVFNPWDCMVGAWTPNWGSISHVIIRAIAGTGTPDFYVDDFKYFEANQKPMICVTFDDSLASQFTNGKAKLDQYDIKATYYTIWDLVGTATYMTQANLDTLSTQGHDISWHGQTNLTTLSSAQQITDLIGMKKFLVTNGYRGSNNYALPNGASTDAVLANVRKYFNSIANIDWLSNTKEYSPNYLINRFSPDSATSTATIQAWIDNAIANNNMAIIAWHGIVAAAPTWAQVLQSTYDTIMDYIGTKKNNGDIDTWTLTDYYATAPTPTDNYWAAEMVAAWIYL